MAKQFYTSISLNGLEVLNLRVQNLASDPTAYGSGHFIYNSSVGALKFHNGSAWLTVLDSSDVASDTASGIVELATSAETQAGTDAARAVTPAGFKAAGDALYAALGHNHSSAYQPLDATLTALAGAATAADKYIYFTGADTAAVGTITTFGRSLADDADAATARGTLGLGGAATLSVGTTAGTVAAGDHTHAALYEPLISKATGYAKWTGSAWAFVNETYSLSSHNHSGVYSPVGHTHVAAEVTDFNTTVRANRLDQMSAPTSAVGMGGQRLTNVGDAQGNTDAVTYGQLIGLLNTTGGAGLNKGAVRAASTANITLSAPGAAIDGVTMVSGDLFLAKDQTTASQNGLYVWLGAAAAATRATNADVSAEVKGGLQVWVNEGTVNADTRWQLTTNDPITLDTTALNFVKDFTANSTSAGAGLTNPSAGVLAVGAGTGIAVNADNVAIDTAVVARKVAANIGDGTNAVFTVTHNLNNLDVLVAVYANSGGAEVECDVARATANTVTLTFWGAIPTTNQFRCVIQG